MWSKTFLKYLNASSRDTNRYDLLCIEGIARALRIYLGKARPPQYKLALPKGGEGKIITATIAPEVRGHTLYFRRTIYLYGRHGKSDLSSPVASCGMSSSRKDLTIPSSTFKTNCTRIYADVDNSSRSAHTIWIRCNHRSPMKLCRQKTSSSCRCPRTRRTLPRN